MKHKERVILTISETGTYLDRDDWRFYRNVIDREGQEYLYVNLNGEPSRITKENAVDLINNFYIQYLQRAILAYSKSSKRIEDFGITRGEYFDMIEGNTEKVLLNKNIKSDDLEDYVEY